MARIPIYSKFIGKNSIASVPLFGYMFRKIHITVERSSMKSRAGIIYRAREAVDAGYNLTFFPEGGVRTTSPPQMTSFSDGAFRLAIEKNLPIVPITFHNNYKILPDDERFVLHPGKMKIVVHEPVSPKINDEAEISALRKEVFEIIQAELNSAHEIT
jgi:1-acyl-sn-glycerol-3-phosphate acyltransferase